MEHAPLGEVTPRTAKRVSEALLHHVDLHGFRLVRWLGEGARAETFQLQNQTDPVVMAVLKQMPRVVVRPGDYKAERAAERQVEEVAKEIDILQHLVPRCGQYILCFARSSEDEVNYYIWTEFLGDYVSLLDLMQRRDTEQRYRDLGPLLVNLVQGLREIHGAGVAHGDIKPENIMVNPRTLDVKYIDFGSACRGDEGCSNARLLSGSPNYMAPELNLERITVPLNLDSRKRADIYQLGSTLLEYLVGAHQFLDIAHQPSPHDRAEDIPSRLTQRYRPIAADLRAMLASDPDDRVLPQLRVSTPVVKPSLPEEKEDGFGSHASRWRRSHRRHRYR